MKMKRVFVVQFCFNVGFILFLLMFKLSPRLISSVNLKCSSGVVSHFNTSSTWKLKPSPEVTYDKTCLGKYIDFRSQLNFEQEIAVNKCIATYLYDSKQGLQQAQRQKNVRYTSHSYLNNSDTLMIEAGGHLGLDVNEFNSRFHPETYIVLEPVLKFYNHLKHTFKGSKNMVLLNYGLDVEDGEFVVDSSSNDGTSLFKKGTQNQQNKEKIKVMSVSKFFDQMKIDVRDIDLLTMNCEGCEYAVLDYLLSSGKIQRVKNIQFQSHRLPGICRPVERFCWYQQLLSKSHKLVYQFRFWWESWTRL